MIRPGELVIVDLAALTWNGFKSCVYRTYCVGGKPTDEHQKTYDLAHKWLWDSIEATKPGVTTADVASKWPSAKEVWGMRRRTRLPRTSGAMVSGSPSTTRRSSPGSGRWTIRSRSSQA